VIARILGSKFLWTGIAEPEALRNALCRTRSERPGFFLSYFGYAQYDKKQKVPDRLTAGQQTLILFVVDVNRKKY
jgi:hypothetical protein